MFLKVFGVRISNLSFGGPGCLGISNLHQNQVSNEKKPGCLGYVRDYITQSIFQEILHPYTSRLAHLLRARYVFIFPPKQNTGISPQDGRYVFG